MNQNQPCSLTCHALHFLSSVTCKTGSAHSVFFNTSNGCVAAIMQAITINSGTRIMFEHRVVPVYMNSAVVMEIACMGSICGVSFALHYLRLKIHDHV